MHAFHFSFPPESFIHFFLHGPQCLSLSTDCFLFFTALFFTYTCLPFLCLHFLASFIYCASFLSMTSLLILRIFLLPLNFLFIVSTSPHSPPFLPLYLFYFSSISLTPVSCSLFFALRAILYFFVRACFLLFASLPFLHLFLASTVPLSCPQLSSSHAISITILLSFPILT